LYYRNSYKKKIALNVLFEEYLAQKRGGEKLNARQKKQYSGGETNNPKRDKDIYFFKKANKISSTKEMSY